VTGFDKKSALVHATVHLIFITETDILADATLFQTAVANVNKVMQKAVRIVAHNHEKQGGFQEHLFRHHNYS
jgi:hypothetical protein